jgi:outer membrane protein OmpA-like peptidoglycan-associated protein
LDVVASSRWQHVRLGVQLGYDARIASSAVGNVYSDDELRWGLGLGFPLRDDTWELGVEWVGAAVLPGAGRGAVGEAAYLPGVHVPSELLLAVMHVPADKPVWMRLGLGPGLGHGFGTPDVRAFAQIGFGRFDRPARDTDGDGLADRADACPAVPEDLDGYDDGDGCPDIDNDADGVLDVDDGPRGEAGQLLFFEGRPGFGACMLAREDDDGFEDGDGCPDLDNDQDGVPDVVDGELDALGRFGLCRDLPEDEDGFVSEDGCPDEDNDGDGIPDVLDGLRQADGSITSLEGYEGFGNCANDAEVVNGVKDDDGCPDEALVELTDAHIVLAEPIVFVGEGAAIDPRSHGVLDAVATVLERYPELTRVEIAGHVVTGRRSAERVALSQERVDMVRRYLVAKGIMPRRLMAIGYGDQGRSGQSTTSEEGPTAPNSVEFVLRKEETEPATEGDGR